MSSGMECLFIELKPGTWYYVLQMDESPFEHGCFCWYDNATGYGPFDSYDAACDHLRENHRNPGGHGIRSLPDGAIEADLTDDKELAELIAKASV